MIAKGTAHNNGPKLARYMTKGKEGERAELWELRGFASADIEDAFRSVHVIAEATKAENPFFHIQIRNPEGDTPLSRSQWEYAANRVERMLGLKDQPRAIAFHVDEKTGHEHMHVAWSRIDEETMTARPLPFFKERLKKISRELELHFGLTLVPNERDSSIKYAPTRDQEEQARRLGVDIHEVRQTIRNCYEHSDCGRSFEFALAQEGLLLAQGDRRDFVVIDQGGGIHALGKRILDVSAAQVRDRLADLPSEHLPSVEQARAFVQELQRSRDKFAPQRMSDPHRDELAWQDALAKAAIDKERVERRFVEQQQGRAAGKEASERSPFEPPKPTGPPHPQLNRTSPEFWFEDVANANTGDRRPEKAPEDLTGAAARIWIAYQRSHDATAFATSLDEHGITLAAVTKEEADRSHRESAFAKEIGRFAPAYHEGEIVAVTETAQIYRLNSRTTGDTRAGVERFLKKLDRTELQGIDATKEAMHERAEAREAYARLMSIVQPVAKKEIDPRPTGWLGREAGGLTPGRAVRRAATMVDKALTPAARIGKTLEVVGNAIESFFAPQLTPEQKVDGAIATRTREIETEQAIDFSRYTAERAQAGQQHEQERQAAKERQQDRERER